MPEDSKVNSFYFQYHDEISQKRYHSPFWIRRYAHRRIYFRTLAHIRRGEFVLDAGCGEGVLSILMAKAGARVTAVDISPANIAAARRQAESEQLTINFIVADASRLPLPENCFDVVVSSHVIEHLPDPIRGLAELLRVTRDKALIALPTCINFASWALLGGDQYWVLSPRSLYGVPIGMARTIIAFVRGNEGPQEGYAGRGDLPHVWRFPWVVKRMVKQVGFQIDELEGGPLLVPYVAHYLGFIRPLQMSLDRWSKTPILRNFGFGLHVVASKHQL